MSIPIAKIFTGVGEEDLGGQDRKQDSWIISIVPTQMVGEREVHRDSVVTVLGDIPQMVEIIPEDSHLGIGGTIVKDLIDPRATPEDKAVDLKMVEGTGQIQDRMENILLRAGKNQRGKKRKKKMPRFVDIANSSTKNLSIIAFLSATF